MNKLKLALLDAAILTYKNATLVDLVFGCTEDYLESQTILSSLLREKVDTLINDNASEREISKCVLDCFDESIVLGSFSDDIEVFWDTHKTYITDKKEVEKREMFLESFSNI